MRKAPNEGGDSGRDAAGGRKGREGCSPLGARSFHMYKGAKRLNDEYRNGKPGEQNAPMARASGCHPSLHVMLDFWSRFFFFQPFVRSLPASAPGSLKSTDVYSVNY